MHPLPGHTPAELSIMFVRHGGVKMSVQGGHTFLSSRPILARSSSLAFTVSSQCFLSSNFLSASSGRACISHRASLPCRRVRHPFTHEVWSGMT